MSDNEGVVSIRSLRDKQRGAVETDLIQVKESEWGRLHAELALKDQALDEIKALHFETPCLCGPFDLPSGHPSCAACTDDDWPCKTLRVLTRLDTQGETK